MKWKGKTLGEICAFRSGVGFKLEYQGDKTGDYPFIKVSDMNLSENQIRINTANHWISGTVRERIRAEPFQAGTTVFAKIGEALKQNRVRLLIRDTIIDNNMMGAIPKREVVEPEFLYHRLSMFDFAATSSGAALPFLTVKVLAESRVSIPPLPAQREIAETLSAYDDLMENNRRRMALMEESARMLYREWFVRLRFPGHEHARITNGVPEGWEPKALGDICTDLRETVSPDALEPDTPYIGLEHIPRRSISLTEWGAAEVVTSTKLRYKTGDILFGKIRPYFHKVGIAFTDGVASSDAIVIRPNTDGLRSLVLMVVSSDEFVAEASQTMREGSKMPRADWKHMIKYPVILPPPGLLADFTETVTAITDQLRNLCFQNQKLRAARDLLLPKLMSGELAV